MGKHKVAHKVGESPIKVSSRERSLNGIRPKRSSNQIATPYFFENILKYIKVHLCDCLFFLLSYYVRGEGNVAYTYIKTLAEKNTGDFTGRSTVTPAKVFVSLKVYCLVNGIGYQLYVISSLIKMLVIK